MIQKIKPDFSFRFEGNIWKIRMDEANRHLVLEIRNGNLRQVSFACIDLFKREILWQDLLMQETWWISLAAVHQNTMLFYLYADNPKPDTSEILSFDLFSKQLLWHQALYRFYTIQEDAVIALKLNETQMLFEKLQLRTGHTLETMMEYNPSLLHSLDESQLIFPEHYLEGTTHFETIKIFLEKILQIRVFGSIDYLEHKNFIIITYFFSKNEEISNNLLILEANAQILLNECINTQTKGVTLDSFFVINHTLISIKNKTELIAYSL